LIIAEKYTYWAQGMAIPDSVAKKMKKLAYEIIWNGIKGIPWSKIAKIIVEGDLKVRDLPIITSSQLRLVLKGPQSTRTRAFYPGPGAMVPR